MFGLQGRMNIKTEEKFSNDIFSTELHGVITGGSPVVVKKSVIEVGECGWGGADITKREK